MKSSRYFSTRAAGLPLGALGLLAIGAAALPWLAPARSAEEAVRIPSPALDEKVFAGPATATFAGGCFWGVQGVFQHVEGVTQAVSGYAGGAAETAHYETVGTGTTGHAESVQVTYDPSKISYGKLLQVFFSVAHNPTQLNYQGPDRGKQYRSTIFVANDEQKRVAQSYIAQLDKSGLFSGPIVTTIETGKTFYPAEDYHQDFMTRNPTYPYIVYNDLPKVEALKHLFSDIYRENPVLVSQNRS